MAGDDSVGLPAARVAKKIQNKGKGRATLMLLWYSPK
jgi:hypothetical protein